MSDRNDKDTGLGAQTGEHRNGAPGDARQASGSPEPPVRYDPNVENVDSTAAGNSRGLGSEVQTGFEDARRFVTAAQITALVSIFFGGVFLSTASVVIAVLGYRKTLARARRCISSDPQLSIATRRARLAIVMSVLALVLNLVAVIYLYPLVMETIQSGDYASLLEGSTAMPSDPGSSASLWD